MPVFQFLAILATALFAGAAIYINVAEHPARMECGTALAATVFGLSYRRVDLCCSSVHASGDRADEQEASRFGD